ncbi:MAG: hypothetical protein M1840_005086 [Geoglossum simile]|nr:MAG: hypothetical protein M1840_005086 [Geoglossum simile]
MKTSLDDYVPIYRFMVFIMNDDYKHRAILQDKQAYFCGNAKVGLNHLNFDTTQSLFNQSNVSRLVKIFKDEDCLRLEPDHYIPAVIDMSQLENALRQSQVSQADLLRSFQTEPPKLLFPNGFTLTCLRGQHRIAAAREFLPPGEYHQWWTVEIYKKGISEDTIAYIRDEYSNSRKPPDGDIYRQVRAYQSRSDKSGELKFLARLSPNKRKAMKQLQKRDWLANALDKLLPYHGLWPALQLGSIPTILSWKCPEEICSYLERVRTIWCFITCDDDSLNPFVDETTVELLQSLAPSSCSGDRKLAMELVETQRVFPKLKSSARRSKVLTRLLSVNGMIFSLHTFFEDTKYLEPMVMTLRGLLPPTTKDSIRDAIAKRYTGVSQKDGQLYTQWGENDERYVPGSEAQRIYFGYLTLCLYGMRHFPSMTNISPRIDKKPEKSIPHVSAIDQTHWHKLAELAYSLGFDSKEIQRLRRENPDEGMVRIALHQRRPEEYYEISDSDFEAEVHRQCEALKKFKRRQQPPPTPKLSDDFPAEPINRRCGKPYESSHVFDRKYLFLPLLYDTEEHTPKNSITSFAVKRYIFFAFFSRDPPDEQTSENTQDAYRSEQHINGSPTREDPIDATTMMSQALVRHISIPEVPNSGPIGHLMQTGPDMNALSTADDILKVIDAVQGTCKREDKVAFFGIKTGTYTLSDNEATAISKTAIEIMESDRSRKFGYVKDGRLKALQMDRIHEMVNQTTNIDYPGIIFYVGNSRSESGAFGMEFVKLCAIFHGGGTRQNRKRRE